MKVKKESPLWIIDALGSRDKPITVEDDDNDHEIISIDDEEDLDDVVCLNILTKNSSNGTNIFDYFHGRPGTTPNAVNNNEKELPLNNVAVAGPSSAGVENGDSKEFRYFRNPMNPQSDEKSSKNDKPLNIFTAFASTSADGGKQHIRTISPSPVTKVCPKYVPHEEEEVLIDNISVRSTEKPFVPPVDPFFPPAPRKYSFSTSTPYSHQFSTPGSADRSRRSSSTATNDSFESNAIRPPPYLHLHYSPDAASSCSNSDVYNRDQPDFSTRPRFRNRNYPPKKYPPRVPESVDVFVTHRDDLKRRVTSEDLDILNNYLGQCMFEEDETDFLMGFEYKKITNGQAQFNCSNRQMAEWTIDKLQKFTELPMKTSLKDMRPKVNILMWMTNLPHLGDAQPRISDVLLGLAKCNPGFKSSFKITVVRVTKQKWKPGKYFFQIVVNQELLSYIRSRMEPPFMRICVLKYYNVKVFFKERG